MREIKTRRVQVKVKERNITYLEKYVVDENGEELFDRNIELANDISLYDEYRIQEGLLPSSRIKKIREKYCLTQKEYALVLGMGEISIHRFENGSIQTEAIDNIMRLSENPTNLKELLKMQFSKISYELYEKVENKINELLALKKYALMDVENINLNNTNVQTENVLDIANIVVKKYQEYINKNVDVYGISEQYISNEKLQKLLYYIQAYSIYFLNKKAFKEKIYFTHKGPIIQELNEMNNCLFEDKETYGTGNITSSLDSIIDEVIAKYGMLETNKLIELCFEELSNFEVNIGKEIKEKKIKEYLEKVYSI